jgi:hypothetical protein
MASHGQHRWYRVVGTATLALFPARAADAQSTRYSAPPECPPAAWFDAELAQRLRGRDAAGRASLAVEIRAAEGGFVGRVQWRDPAGTEVMREVRHESCEQVARALALIGAVLIETSAPPNAKSEASPSAALVPASPPTTPTALPPPAEVPLWPPSSPHGSWTWRTGPSVSLAIMSAVTPILLGGPRAGWELVGEEPLRRGGLILGLSLGHLATGTRPYGVWQASLEWSALRLDACGLWRVTERLGAAPCLFMDAGELRGEGTNNAKDLRRGSLWLAPGLAGRVEWELFGPLMLRLEAGGFFPLWPPIFYIRRPDGGQQKVHDVPHAGLTMEAGLVARLP